MAYNSILLHLDVNEDSDAKLKYATEITRELDAYLIGFCACCYRLTLPSEGWVPLDEKSTLTKKAARHALARKKEEFLDCAGDNINSAWRQSEHRPTEAALAAARSADLIISTTPNGASTGDAYQSVDRGDLVRGAGRPVLLLSENAVFRLPKKIVIGWKDTTESRRAVSDAVPLLDLSKEVIVAAAIEENDHDPDQSLADVVAYLMRHGVTARHHLIKGDDAVISFQQFATAENADMVVTGAFSHSRMREWIFGGMTRSLLDNNSLNRLMSG